MTDSKLHRSYPIVFSSCQTEDNSNLVRIQLTELFFVTKFTLNPMKLVDSVSNSVPSAGVGHEVSFMLGTECQSILIKTYTPLR